MKRLLVVAALALLPLVACSDDLPTAADPDDFAGRWIGETGGLTLALIVDRAGSGQYEGQGFLYGTATSQSFTFTGTVEGDSVFLEGANVSLEGAVLEAGRRIQASLDAPPYSNWGFRLQRPQ